MLLILWRRRGPVPCDRPSPSARAAGLQLRRTPGLLAACTPAACAVRACSGSAPRLLCKTASLILGSPLGGWNGYIGSSDVLLSPACSRSTRCYRLHSLVELGKNVLKVRVEYYWHINQIQASMPVFT